MEEELKRKMEQAIWSAKSLFERRKAAGSAANISFSHRDRIYISASGDAWGGGLQLFALGLGMGTPLVVFGAGGGALLPKSGAWMNGVRNAFGVLFLKIAPFVMTLCTTTICEGICYVYTQGSPTGSAAPFIRALGTGRLFGIPFSTLIWLALAAAMWVVLRFTALGRRLYAVGGSPKAARLSGIANVRVVAGAYIFCALMSAVAGLILTGYHNIASLTLAGDYSMNSLAAALIGGNAIEGGRGGVWGVVLGSFFMMLLMAILTMLGISQVGKLIIQGCIILAVVAAQQLWKKD